MDPTGMSLEFLQECSGPNIPTANGPIDIATQDRLVIGCKAGTGTRRRGQIALDGPIEAIQNQCQSILGGCQYLISRCIKGKGIPFGGCLNGSLHGTLRDLHLGKGTTGIIASVIEMNILSLSCRHGGRDSKYKARAVKYRQWISRRVGRQFHLCHATWLLQIPQPHGAIGTCREKGIIRGTHGEGGDLIRVTTKLSQDLVIVER
mmetsp:Transcript_23643/g.55051  ORF Transcript_23643/g.55051 Transcript_23643/m.55051 type:complete len:205 (-) Transcript_23643:20-634(-)